MKSYTEQEGVTETLPVLDYGREEIDDLDPLPWSTRVLIATVTGFPVLMAVGVRSAVFTCQRARGTNMLAKYGAGPNSYVFWLEDVPQYVVAGVLLICAGAALAIALSRPRRRRLIGLVPLAAAFWFAFFVG